MIFKHYSAIKFKNSENWVLLTINYIGYLHNIVFFISKILSTMIEFLKRFVRKNKL